MNGLKLSEAGADDPVVLRPATPDALDRLLLAAHRSDHDLDAALVQLGVLPPLDLTEIRAWLTLGGIGLRAACNPDGHRVVVVALGRRPLARIHHDGRVVTSDQAPLLESA